MYFSAINTTQATFSNRENIVSGSANATRKYQFSDVFIFTAKNNVNHERQYSLRDSER
jgi:hypothetical protein